MQLSEAEWKVMNSVWKRGAATAREVMEDLSDETDWAYSTVKTLLTRMTEKGAVEARFKGNTAVYRPVLARADARREALRGLLNRAFDGAFGQLFHHLATGEQLSAKDRERLRAVLEGIDADAATNAELTDPRARQEGGDLQ